MIMMVLGVVVISAVIGVVAKLVVDKMRNEYEITWKEYALTMAVISIVLAPVSIKIGWEIAKKNKISYNEYWNGWESSAEIERIKCERDGSCRHCYDCDPYVVMVEHQSCDSKNNCTTYYTPETRYHSCPYVDEEYTYVVGTTLGNYTISSNRFPENPQAHRWREDEDIPSGVISCAGVGIPPFWQEVKNRLDAGLPGPVSVRKSYDNYIYASDRTILKQYSGEVEAFKKEGLLPSVQSGIFSFYLADKIWFVGFSPEDAHDWQEKLRYFDAAFGSNLQGDMHIVIIKNDKVNRNPDAYAIALKAHWMDNKTFGKNAFSKNGVAVILGTEDGNTVSWARSFTGMPMGNEGMLTAINARLKGAPLDPKIVIGDIKLRMKKEAKENQNDPSGILEDVVFGKSEKATRFARIAMTGKTGKGAGFLYMKGEIQPTEKQKAFVFLVSALLCALSWTAAILVGTRKNYYGTWR